MTTEKAPPRRCATRVLKLCRLSATGYELTLERAGMPFRAGQLVTIHGPTVLDDRSYTISSGEQDDHLQVIFRLIPSGKLTPRLSSLNPGDTVEISGPYGEFTLRDPARPIIFIATGTGVAPCRSYLRTFQTLPLTLIHGVRNTEDLFYRDDFSRQTSYVPCTSGERGPGFHGRVTDYCLTRTFDKASHFYLCGANEMFYDMRDILTKMGFDHRVIFTEAYYYRSDE